MTGTLVPARPAASMTIRSYRPTDHRGCRALWAELTEEHRIRYDDTAAPDGDPGAGFEEYLTRLELAGMWVAEDAPTAVVGFVGLILDGRGGAVDPVVVAADRRGHGIGRVLLGHVADQARGRGLRRLTISPAVRNIDAIKCLRAAGWDTVANVTLSIELRPGGPARREGLELHDLQFRY